MVARTLAAELLLLPTSTTTAPTIAATTATPASQTQRGIPPPPTRGPRLRAGVSRRFGACTGRGGRGVFAFFAIAGQSSALRGACPEEAARTDAHDPAVRPTCEHARTSSH